MPDRLHALAFNELTRALGDVDRFVALSEREQIARRLVALVRRELAADLKRAAAGRREYADRVPVSKAGEMAADPSLASMRQALLDEVACYETAALMVEDPSHLMGAVPSWRWTDEEAASIHSEPARKDTTMREAQDAWAACDRFGGGGQEG